MPVLFLPGQRLVGKLARATGEEAKDVALEIWPLPAVGSSATDGQGPNVLLPFSSLTFPFIPGDHSSSPPHHLGLAEDLGC